MICQLFSIRKSYIFLSLGDMLQLSLRPVRLSGHVIPLTVMIMYAFGGDKSQ